jgi:hypothetical protein
MYREGKHHAIELGSSPDDERFKIRLSMRNVKPARSFPLEIAFLMVREEPAASWLTS